MFKGLVLGLHRVDSSIVFGGSFSIIRQGVKLGRYPHDLDVFIRDANYVGQWKQFLIESGYHEVTCSNGYARDAVLVMMNDLGFKVEFYEIKPGTITVCDPEYKIAVDDELENPVRLVSLYDIIKWKLTYLEEGNDEQAAKCLRDIEAITHHVYASRVYKH
ncbi:hypothetical protein PM21P2_00040 [Parabacteroides phage PM21P2]|nr:hypothetical protein PM21P1_00016 [Parabacteroides phage PM21P1]WAX17312.1 hypothetical protein PM21P2_00040 [Parabacteroides phage PM21P2]